MTTGNLSQEIDPRKGRLDAASDRVSVPSAVIPVIPDKLRETIERVTAVSRNQNSAVAKAIRAVDTALAPIRAGLDALWA